MIDEPAEKPSPAGGAFGENHPHPYPLPPAGEGVATVGVVLAGGLARRMGGGGKGMRMVGGQTVIARVVERLKPQVAALIINANGDPARFAPLGLPVVADGVPDHPGPLAGVLAGLDWAAEHARHAEWIVTVPGDGPFLPADLVGRLHQARAEACVPFACAASGGWAHPVIGVWPQAMRETLRLALLDGIRKIDAFTGAHGAASAEWATVPVDPFFNVNTPEELAEADRLASL